MARKKKRAKRAGPGLVHEFHGAFKSKAKATAKARSLKKGFVVGRMTKGSGDFRWVVMTKGGGVPF